MKLTIKFISIITVLFTVAFQATNAEAQGMSEEQIQQMILQTQAAQECFGEIDQSAFAELEAKGKKMEAEIKALCAEGKRDEAMSTAMKYGMEMQNDPQIKEMRKCGEMMQGMMDNMPQPYMPPSTDDSEDGGHICDDM